MARKLHDIERDALQLSPQERAELARELIASLDAESEDDVESLWLDEAERRYEKYRKGELTACPAADVLAELWQLVSRWNSTPNSAGLPSSTSVCRPTRNLFSPAASASPSFSKSHLDINSADRYNGCSPR